MRRALDIVGQPCYACSKGGKARVCYYAKKTHFFYGCDKSTAEDKCKGTKAWQSIDVPEELRIQYAEENNIKYVPKAKRDKKPNKKRPPQKTVTLSQKIRVEGKMEGGVRVSTLIEEVGKDRKKKVSRPNDAAMWTKKEDDEYTP